MSTEPPPPDDRPNETSTDGPKAGDDAKDETRERTDRNLDRNAPRRISSCDRSTAHGCDGPEEIGNQARKERGSHRLPRFRPTQPNSDAADDQPEEREVEGDDGLKGDEGRKAQHGCEPNQNGFPVRNPVTFDDRIHLCGTRCPV